MAAPPTLADLGAEGCLALCALAHSQQQRLPVSPTQHYTLEFMSLLKRQEIIETPWPASKWEQDPTAERTPLEGLEWRYVWAAYPRDGLYRATVEHLEDLPRTEEGDECRASIWRTLAGAEAEAFYEQQLTRHGFDSEWARDMCYAIRETRPAMSIAKWRYCAWAAVRYGASASLRSTNRGCDDLRELIYKELLSRASRVANGAWDRCELTPSHPQPRSAASRILTSSITNLGMTFWTTTPSMEAISGKQLQR
jgi:hypothetical protein